MNITLRSVLTAGLPMYREWNGHCHVADDGTGKMRGRFAVAVVHIITKAHKTKPTNNSDGMCDVRLILRVRKLVIGAHHYENSREGRLCDEKCLSKHPRLGPTPANERKRRYFNPDLL